MSHHRTRLALALLLIVGALLYLYESRNENAGPISISTSTTTVTLPGVISSVGRQTLVGPARPPASSSELEAYLKSQDPRGDWRVSKSEDGRTIAISGGLIHEDFSTAEKQLQFAQYMASLMGVEGQQIQRSAQVLEGTQYTEAKQFDQKYEGYQVFGGLMKIFTRKEDGAIYYIANETQRIGDVDLRTKYSVPDVKELISLRYADKKEVVIESLSEQPVIYVTSPGQGELAWEVVVVIQRPLFQRRHLLVSAITGNILKDTNLVKR